jgi:hypothetical protein
MPTQLRRYGWRPDSPDHRDLRFRLSLAGPPLPPSFLERIFPCARRRPALPTYVDLTAKEKASLWPAIFDQGVEGSCTAQSVVGMGSFLLAVEGEEVRDRVLSRQLLYGESRGWAPVDDGATLRDSMKALARVGDCPEYLWPYEKPWAVRPPPSVYAAAKRRADCVYARLSTVQDMRQCLADGFPFVGGFTVFEAFEGLNARNSLLPLPTPGEEPLGGHAVCFVGYDDDAKAFRVRNSWGVDWGNVGYFWMPFSYAADRNLSDDFWTLRRIATVPGEG